MVHFMTSVLNITEFTQLQQNELYMETCNDRAVVLDFINGALGVNAIQIYICCPNDCFCFFFPLRTHV